MTAKRYVGIGKEPEFGTAVAATRFIESIEKIEPDQGWIITKSIAMRERRKKNLGPFRGRGNIGAFDAEPENIGEILLGILGASSPSQQGGTSAYKHTFTPADTIPSWTVRIGVELKERVIPGSLFNALTLQFATGKNLEATVEVFGPSVNAESDDTLGSPTFSQLQAFVFHQGLLKLATVDKSTEVYDGQIIINNGIPYERGSLDSRYFATKRMGERVVNGKLSLYFDSVTQRSAFLAGTEFALNLKFTGPQIGTTGYYYTLELDLPKCVYTKGTPHVGPISEPLVLDAPFEAFYDTAGGFNAEIKAYLTNEITSY